MDNSVENIKTETNPSLWKGLEKLYIFKNKYLLATIFFLVWIFFFDPKDVPSSINRKQIFNKLQKSETHLTQQIIETKKDLNLLKTNPQTIEKFARENYLMKKDNEDIFILPSVETK